MLGSVNSVKLFVGPENRTLAPCPATATANSFAADSVAVVPLLRVGVIVVELAVADLSAGVAGGHSLRTYPPTQVVLPPLRYRVTVVEAPAALKTHAIPAASF